MVGLQIFVEFTDAEGKTYESDPTAPVDDGIYTFEIEDATATKVNEITVTFADAVEAENVTFAVTKGTESVPIEKVTADNWSIDEDVVTLKTSANMTTGTYTVTATDSVTKDTDSAEFDVEKQAVARIEIKNTKAYTNADDNANIAHTKAYAYYDVFDQYNQSIRSSASIQWAGSCDIKSDKATGMLTLTKSDNRAWVYGEQIYITGVYTKTGVATNATLTVDSEQALNSIDVVGFLKKGTSDIVEDLPKDFKEGEYYMLFHALDQNDCPLKADQVGKEEVTFISDSVLVVKELTFDGTPSAANKGFTVKGTEYNGVYVNPGIRVADGGEVTITAIANKTGNKTDYNFMVGEDPVVESFTLEAPSGVVADGDTNVTIPFKALDQKGNAITNFRTLAKQKIFNTLSFNTSEGKLTLAETDERTAKLTWSDEEKYQNDAADPTKPWKESVTTDDIDRPISLTVVVVGGEPDNEMLYVSDKRRPNAIAEVKLDDVYVEGAKLGLTITEDKDTDTFKYYDQYGKQIGTDWGADNGFFAAAAAGVLKNTDFNGYDFGVRIENAGTGKIVDDTTATTTIYTEDPDIKKSVVVFGTKKGFKTKTDIQSIASGEGFKFDIVKFKQANGLVKKDPNDWESVSPSKYKPITVVDITQVKNFQVGDLNTFYTGALEMTGDKIISKAKKPGGNDTYFDLLVASPAATAAGNTALPTTHLQKVKVTGTYNGSSVSIPDEYFGITTTRGTLVDTDKDNKFDTTGTNKIGYSDLYEKTSPNGTAKPGTDEVVATINNIYAGDGFWTWDAINGLHVDSEISYANANNTLNNKKQDAQAKAWNDQFSLEETDEARKAAADMTNPNLTANTWAGQDEYLAADRAAYKTALSDYNTAKKKADDAALEVAKYQDQAGNFVNPEEANLEASVVDENTNKADVVTQAKAITVNAIALATVAVDAAAVPTNITTAGNTTDAEIALALKGVIDGHGSPMITANNSDQVLAYLKAARDLAKVRDTDNKAQADEATKEGAVYSGAGTTSAAVRQAAVDDTADKGTGLLGAKELLILSENEAGRKAAVAMGAEIDNAIAENNVANISKTKVHYNTGMYDSTKKEIKFSDQAPYAANITGLLDSYTFTPVLTAIDGSKTVVGGFYDATQKKGKGDLKIVDQYGVDFAGTLEYTISNAVEDKDGYAENNFKVSDNGTAAPTIEGAEIGDKFDLVVSVQGSTLKKTTKVTVGADMNASIVNSTNYYTNGDTAHGVEALKDVLEAQRKAGLQ